jgi:Type IV secretion system pilin
MMKKLSGLFLGVLFWLSSNSKVIAVLEKPALDTCNGSGINTAIGCMPTDINAFITWLLSWLFGVAGGIAFVLMVFGFIMLGTSQGDEKKVAGAKETITSAITGLLVSIFAVFILKLIAVDILQIPGIT